MTTIVKMGFEGKLYYGVADGSTEATTPITNHRDVGFSLDPDKADTTVKGDGSAPPLKTEQVVAIAQSIEWTMLNKTDDNILAALRAAAAIGGPVALRMKDNSAGKGFRGEVSMGMKNGQPIGGEQTFVFTATPTSELGKVPEIYV